MPERTGSAARIIRSLSFVFGTSPVRSSGVLLLAVAGGLLPVAVAWQTKLLVDALAGPGATGSVTAVIAGLLGTMALIQLAPTVRTLLESDLGRAVELAARARSFEKVNTFGGLRYFEDPGFHDDLRLAVSAGEQVPTQILSSLTGLIQGTVTLAGFAVALAAIDWRAAVLVLLAGLPRLYVELRLGRDRFLLDADLSPSERLQFFYGSLQTDPVAAKEIRLFGLGRFFQDRMIGQLRHAHRATRRLDVRTARSQAWLDLLALVPLVLCLAYAARAATTGVLGAGDVVLLLTSLGAVETALAAVAVLLARVNQLSLTVTRFDDLMRTPPDIERHVGDGVPPLQTLQLDDVWFRYRDDLPWVLKGVSLQLEAGDSLAVVGVNGAGKSTLVKLLCRLYDPTRGRILWNGVDLRELDVDTLRGRLGSVFQDFVSYDLTLRDNIGVGDLTRHENDDDLLRVAAEVGLADLVKNLPHGLETNLSRVLLADHEAAGDSEEETGRGTFLSGGQWQRLAIARMLLRADRDLLILDEPTSGLDPAAEHNLNTLVQKGAEGRTRVLVSHRLNAVRMADRIVVLDDGVIGEDGDHDQLMTDAGGYARLFDLQRAGYLD